MLKFPQPWFPPSFYGGNEYVTNAALFPEEGSVAQPTEAAPTSPSPQRLIPPAVGVCCACAKAAARLPRGSGRAGAASARAEQRADDRAALARVVEGTAASAAAEGEPWDGVGAWAATEAALEGRAGDEKPRARRRPSALRGRIVPWPPLYVKDGAGVANGVGPLEG